MGTMVNPYIAGAPVTEARMFFGREDVFHWIENSIAGQYTDHILVIHGQRRVGKTSVLKQLGNRLPKRFIPVFFDLQGRTHTTLDRFLWWLAREIVRVLKQDRGIEVPLPEKEAFAADLEYFEHRFLADLKPVLGNDTLLLTFDEFDNLEESEIKEELARPLIDYLRRLMGNTGLNFIFSIGSSGRKLENMQAAYTEFFKTALYKKISFLDENQTRSLITRPVENLIEYDRRAVTRIYQIAGGHPYFTQLTCHELFAKCQNTDERHIHEESVNDVLDDVVERGTVNLKFVWDEASDIEKWSLAALAQLDKTEDRALADFLRKQRVRFSETDLTSGLLHLREKDILSRENRFVIHLMKLWLQKNRPMEQAREELTEVNPIANRYIEIGLEFKDAGVYDRAIESFQEALGVAKDNIQAQVNIALTYMDQKSHSNAVVEFEKALVMDDEDVSARSGLCEAHLALGDAAMQRGRTKEAVQSYQRVLAINAEHTEARQRMAEIACQQAEKALSEGRDEEALSAFAEALKYTPEDPTLLARVEQVQAEKKAKVLATLLARSEREAGARNWEKALAALNEALEIAPADESILKKIEALKARQLDDQLQTILLKADQAEKSSRWDVAIAALKEYLTLKADDTSIQQRLASLVEARHAAWLKTILTRTEQAVVYQKWDEAFNALNEVLSLEPENDEILKKMDEVRKAQRTARLEVIFKQADQAAQAGKWDDAIRVLKEGIAFAPEEERLQARLAQVLEAKRAARLKAALRLAETAAASGKWNVAIDSLNEILSAEPGNVEVQKKLQDIRQRQRESQLSSLRNQAKAMARAERFDEALTAWQEYLRLEPEDAQNAQAEIDSVNKAQALAKSYAEAKNAYAKRNYDKAIGLLKGIVEQDYDYRDASHLLAESIELRRTARKWWQSRWLWGAGMTAVVLIAGWFAFRPGSPLLSTSAASPTVAPATTQTPISDVASLAVTTATAPPTVTAAPLPYAWVRLNSGQSLVRDVITAIVFDSTDPGIIYLGTANSGIYKSIDGGTSWQPSHNGLRHAEIHSMAIDPQDPNTLYATGNIGGLHVSHDRGETWNFIDITNDPTRTVCDPTTISIDPNDPAHLLWSGGCTPMYHSEDRGASWSPIPNASRDAKGCPARSSAMISPTDSNVYLALTWNEGNCTGGLYVSVDRGRTWELTEPRGPWFWQSQLAASKTETGSYIYAVAGDDLENSSNFLFASSDSGITWERPLQGCNRVATGPEGNAYAACGSLYHSPDGLAWESVGDLPISPQTMAVSPHNPNLIFLGGSGLYISVDGGRTWEERSSGLPASRLVMRLHPTNPQTLYGSHDTGNDANYLYQSADAGRNWIMLTEQGKYFAVDNIGQTIYRTDYPAEGVNAWISSDAGKTWDELILPFGNQMSPGGNLYLFAHPTVPGKIYATVDTVGPSALYSSSDSGTTWSSPVSLENAVGFVRLSIVDGSNTMYAAGANGIARSTNNGESWSACSAWEGGVDLVNPLVTTDPRDGDHVYFATLGNGVMTSQDGCASWQTSNNGLGSLFVYTVIVDPNHPDTLYAGTDGGAYISTNDGETWGQANDGLLGATVVYSIVVDSESNVYAATPYGIFKLEAK